MTTITPEPSHVFHGPTSFVLNILANSGTKGISQVVAVSSGSTYIASIWVRPDRACTWTAKVVPASGSTVTTTTSLTAGTFQLVKAQITPSANCDATVSFTTADIGVMELSDAQFCRSTSAYDPAVNIVPNAWTRGGLNDDVTATMDLERWDSDSGQWTPVLMETYTDSLGTTQTSFTSRYLFGGAETFTARDLFFPLDETLYYRARINHLVGASSPDSGSTPVAAISDPRWLIVPTLKGRTNGDVLAVYNGDETFGTSSNSRAGVFDTLGRSNPIVVTDSVVGGDRGKLTLTFLSADDYKLFELVRKSQCPVLLRAGKYGFSKWIRFTGNRDSSFVLGIKPKPTVPVSWVEVDPPKNA